MTDSPAPIPTRDSILDAACRLFGEKGFDATTIRAIAKEAGVDPALVMHYFKNKAGLFDAVTDTVSELLEGLMHTHDEGLNARAMAEFYYDQWEHPVVGPRMKALVRSGMSSESARTKLQRVFASQMESLAGQHALRSEKLPFAAASLFGVALGRHVLQLPAFTGLTRDEMVETMTPALQAIFDQG